METRQISQPLVIGTVTGTFLDGATGTPLVGAEVPLILPDGTRISGLTNQEGYVAIESPAGEIKLKTINYNGNVYKINEININVTIGDIFPIGTVGVDWT